ncbi:hypothetical protein EVAR_53484_1 [Eumeta japonica]|uniref:Uncharacterized protein n=1 Tax=Eumeta variegata TaxID=151549 RepID=A0A4C1YWE4_EUMVA|nr:hypothetical protein EVAR_53484_1 [Eumeta japonica]
MSEGRGRWSKMQEVVEKPRTARASDFKCGEGWKELDSSDLLPLEIQIAIEFKVGAESERTMEPDKINNSTGLGFINEEEFSR